MNMANGIPPVVSIVIPTRNRAETAIECVNTLLQYRWDNVQIIVHDCSDAPLVETQWNLRTADANIEYFRVEPTSMTDNWNAALGRAIGEYVTVIGDDDSILSYLPSFALWARENEFDAVGFPLDGACFRWPDFPSAEAGTLTIRDYTGLARGFRYKQKLLQNFRSPIHRLVPSLYRGLVSLRLLSSLKEKTGLYVDSTCPDYYSMAAIAAVAQRAVMVDVPLFIDGKTARSNSGRLAMWRSELPQHEKEYQTNTWPEGFPDFSKLHLNLYTYIAGGIGKAYQNLGLPHNGLPHVYALTILTRQPLVRLTYNIHKYLTHRSSAAVSALVQLTYYVLYEITVRLFRYRFRLLPFLEGRNSATVRCAKLDEAINVLKADLDIRGIHGPKDISMSPW